MLDMGQFSYAFEQMNAWLKKTETMLDGVDARPSGGLRQVEIELCKLCIIQNDMAAHQPSFEAIQVPF